MTTAVVSYELNGSVAVIGLDDGKANAISHDLVDELHAALDRAEAEAFEADMIFDDIADLLETWRHLA